MTSYKRFLIAAGGLVAVMLLVFLFIKADQYDKLHPNKYICVKSHTESNYVYGMSMGFDGKMGMHWHWEHVSKCDKEIINPEWTKINDTR
jgi:hypothetical protein